MTMNDNTKLILNYVMQYTINPRTPKGGGYHPPGVFPL